MDLIRWMGRMFVRFVALSVLLVSAWIFLVNLDGHGARGWILVWILGSGLVGALGGVAYLLSVDGDSRFHTRSYRWGGWAAMLVAVLLPTSLTVMLVPLVLALTPTLFTLPRGSFTTT